MDPYPLQFDSGCSNASLPDDLPSLSSMSFNPLRDAVAREDPALVIQAMSGLARRSVSERMTSAEIALALTDNRDSGTVLHLARETGRGSVLQAVLAGIETFAMAHQLHPDDLSTLLRAVDGHDESVLQQLAASGDASMLTQFGESVMRLHDSRCLSDQELTRLLLQRSHDDTPLQFALRRGGPPTVEAVLKLWAEGLIRQSLDPRDISLALLANRGNDLALLISPFATANVPGIRAVLLGLDALRDTGRMPDELLFIAVTTPFEMTNSCVLDVPAMRAERREAQDLVDATRARWRA